MESLLTDKQKKDLHQCIFGYIANFADQSLLTNLGKILGEDLLKQHNENPEFSRQNANFLEKKWLSIIRLQRKVMDLEQRLEKSEKEKNHQGTNKQLINPSSWLPTQEKFSLIHKQTINSISFHPIQSLCASASDDGNIRIWDWELGELEKTIKAHTRGVLSVDYNFEGILASCSSDLTIKLWNSEYENIRTLTGHDHTISCIKFTSNGQHLVSASRDKTVRIWAIQSGYCIRTLYEHTDWIKSCDVLNETFIASAGIDQIARISDFNTGDTRLILIGHEHVIEGIHIYENSPNHAGLLIKLDPSSEWFVITWSRDKSIRIWNSRAETLLSLTGHDNWIRDVLLHPGGRFIISVSDDKTIRCWDLKQGGRCVKIIEAHSHFITCLAWPPRDQNDRIRPLLATGSVDTKLKIWQ